MLSAHVLVLESESKWVWLLVLVLSEKNNFALEESKWVSNLIKKSSRLWHHFNRTAKSENCLISAKQKKTWNLRRWLSRKKRISRIIWHARRTLFYLLLTTSWPLLTSSHLAGMYVHMYISMFRNDFRKSLDLFKKAIKVQTLNYHRLASWNRICKACKSPKKIKSWL